jgi:hypothetical protein
MKMASNNYFPKRPQTNPTVYAYSENNPNLVGMLKVGFSTRDAEIRVAEQYPVLKPGGKPYKIEFAEPAIRPDGTTFTDRDLHRWFRKHKYYNPEGEWFECTLDDVKAAYIAVRDNIDNTELRTNNFKMRPEQEYAVNATAEYFTAEKKSSPSRSPKFLWNAKMRFGKTFATYQLAKKMGMKRVLVLTFKPAVEGAWDEDLLTHIDFEGWQFISRNSLLAFDTVDWNNPVVCFGSFQDFLGTNENGGIKAKNEWVHTINWDMVVFDEYHFGAWRENAKKLFDNEDEDVYEAIDIEKYQEEEAGNAINETFLPITTNYYLFLSGTPFRAINSGEFIEDQIFNWTYSDEQRAKEEWGNQTDNPYASLPRMVLMTYKLPEEIIKIAKQGEFNEFDLNVFFSATGKGESAVFVYEEYVQKWLDLIRGSYLPTTTDELKLGGKRPPMPYSHVDLLSTITHTLWFLPNVASCHAMANLLKKRQNSFYHDYKINVAAGARAGVGLKALDPVEKAMKNPLKSKTITLSCGKLTTGVTIRPWAGIFMLRNLASPETYFQAAFRVQSPWVIDNEDGTKTIMKTECYIFDFALDRALRQISDYSCRLNVEETNPEKKVGEFIKFLPVLAFDGSSMTQVNPADVLDIAMAGTSATLLAKRWESALLVNVDNDTLQRLMNNPDAMNALMNIEGFRALNKDIQTIINKSEAVKKAKKEKNEKLPPKERKELTEAEKEYKSIRKQIQDKLIKFATRIPVFMYLTDYREYSLKDVITQLEPGLFKKVTGLNVKDFELLVSLGVFNGPLMNDAVYKFKRYEDSSLSYTGINKHEGERVGGWDTTISSEEYTQFIKGQAAKLERAAHDVNDVITAVSSAVSKLTEPEKKDVEKSHSTIINPKPIQPTANIPAKVVEENRDVEFNQKVVKGTKLLHKRFGTGTVIEINVDTSIMLVKFEVGEKRFEFPQAFVKGFLQINN